MAPSPNLSHSGRGTLSSPLAGEEQGEGVLPFHYGMKKNSQQVTLARALRRKQTEAEKALWARLRNRQLDGVKFRRQQPLGRYIVDVVGFDRKLIIEIDGGQHNEAQIRERDEQRTTWLESEGFQVMRFWSNDVLLNIEGVLARIREALVRDFT